MNSTIPTVRCSEPRRKERIALLSVSRPTSRNLSGERDGNGWHNSSGIKWRGTGFYSHSVIEDTAYHMGRFAPSRALAATKTSIGVMPLCVSRSSGRANKLAALTDLKNEMR